jgi:hypothetical protein
MRWTEVLAQAPTTPGATLTARVTLARREGCPSVRGFPVPITRGDGGWSNSALISSWPRTEKRIWP